MINKWLVVSTALGLASLMVFGVLRIKAVHDTAYVSARAVTVPRPYPRAGQAVDGLVFSPDGKMLAAADTQTGISLWNVPDLKFGRRVGQSIGDGVSTFHWSPTGNVLTLADSSRIRRWAVRRNELAQMPIKQVQFRRVGAKKEYWNVFQIHVLSPTGSLAAGADAEGDIVAWNVQTGEPLFSADAMPMDKNGSTENLCDIAFSPNDRFIAISSFVGGEKVANNPLDIVIRSLQTGKIVHQWQWKEAYLPNIDNKSGGNLSNTGLVFSPDGSAVAVADASRVTIWNVTTGKLRQTCTATENGFGGRKRLVFFHDEPLIAGAGWGEAVPVWNAITGKLVQNFHAAGADVEALAVSPDDKWLVTGEQSKSADGKISCGTSAD